MNSVYYTKLLLCNKIIFPWFHLQNYYHYECEPYAEDSTWKFFFSPSFVVSFVMTLTISLFVSPIIARLLFTSEKYPSLEKKKTCFTHVLASYIHGLFTTATLTYLFITGDLGSNLAHSKSHVGFMLLQVTLALYVAKIIAHMLDKNYRGKFQLAMHHIGRMVIIGSILFHQGFLMHVVCLRLLTHVANLFNHPFYVLTTFNKKDSPVFTVVSVGMVIAGFLVRVAPIVLYWKITFTAIFLPCAVISLPFKIVGLGGTIVFDLYNLYLVYKMLKGCVKHLKRKQWFIYLHYVLYTCTVFIRIP